MDESLDNGLRHDGIARILAISMKIVSNEDPDISSLVTLISDVMEWRQAYSDYENEIGDIFAGGDKIAVCFTFRGTNDGPSGEDPPTGQKIEATEMLIWRFENGKVVEIWDEFDSLGFMQQLGFELKPKEVKK